MERFTMRENDVIVIGGGLAGLTAAAVAAKAGKKVTMLSLGAGTLAIGGGVIDMMGYGNGGKPYADPLAAMAEAESGHPYKIIGEQAVKAAVNFFLEMCEDQGYPYLGSLQEMQWIPTAAGTLKPTCLVPKTMDAAALKNAEKVYIVGFSCLKDYYPHLVAKNLKSIPGYDKDYQLVTVDPGLCDGRDVTTLDVARWMDTEEGRKACIRQLKGCVAKGAAVLMPPVLGTTPDYRIMQEMENALGCHVVETVVVPPSITGYRLRLLMLSYLKKLGVKIVEQATVAKALVKNGRCEAVITEGIDRERTYYAKNFILANGGFYGGGIIAEPGRAIEPIFNLPIQAPANHEEWGNSQLFSQEKQPFAKIGVAVDEKMRPLDDKGNVVLQNVFIAGRNLRGYDFCFEKSGNGVALASGYQAAMSM
jgi:glycerol-3-phosphate dehydrogenase subunit B